MDDEELTPEEIDQIYFECGQLNKPSLSYLNERLVQAQLAKVQKARLDRPELREKIAQIIDECDEWRPPSGWSGASHSVDRYKAADQILSFIPDEEEIRNEQYYKLQHHYDIAMKVAVEQAKHEESERITRYLDEANDTRDLDKRLQALKGDS